MCTATKCCYCVPLEVGCKIIAIFTLVLSITCIAWTSACLFVEEEHRYDFHNVFSQLGLDPEKHRHTIEVMFISAIVFSVLWMTSSVMLLIGIKKNQPFMVAAYFLYGILMTILFFLAALLFLLQQKWVLSLLLVLFKGVYIHCLAVVYSVYERMPGGFSRKSEDSMEEDLISIQSEE